MLKPIVTLVALFFCAPSPAAVDPLALPPSWGSLLGPGINVDWALTERGIREFDPLAVRDFQLRGIGHVRIRVAGEATHQRLIHLRRIVEACQKYHVVPIISYEAERLKARPTAENAAALVAWWTTVARFFAHNDGELAFDILSEPAGKLSASPQLLNALYQKSVTAIHKISPQRRLFIAPRLHAAPEALATLKIPPSQHGLIMADWHLFPGGPQLLNGKEQWSSGTAVEKAAIHRRIAAAQSWQQKTGIHVWLGAWSPGNRLSPERQAQLATFVVCELQRAHIPYALNNSEKFYDGEEGAWRPEMEPVLDAFLNPQCS